MPRRAHKKVIMVLKMWRPGCQLIHALNRDYCRINSFLRAYIKNTRATLCPQLLKPLKNETSIRLYGNEMFVMMTCFVQTQIIKHSNDNRNFIKAFIWNFNKFSFNFLYQFDICCCFSVYTLCFIYLLLKEDMCGSSMYSTKPLR